MGLFSFLFGGKKPKATPVAKEPAGVALAEKVAVAKAAPAKPVAVKVAAAAPAPETPGILQAKLRLKLASSLKSGHQDAAYEAARALADIQVRAGRKTVARVWQQQADRIKDSMTL